MGGTQSNQIMIDSLLQSYQGVIAAKTGHVSVHEAGAIEFGGHKVLELDTADGKLTAQQIKETIEDIGQMAITNTWSCQAWSTSHNRLSLEHFIQEKNWSYCSSLQKARC